MNGSAKQISPGQTIILRFDLIIEEEKSFDLKFLLETSLSTYTTLAQAIEIKKFFIANVGFNYPCVSGKFGSCDFFENANAQVTGGLLSVGDIDQVPLHKRNVSANTISAEAHIRLKTTASVIDLSQLLVSVKPQLDSVTYPFLDKNINSFVFVPLNNFSSYTNFTVSLLLVINLFVHLVSECAFFFNRNRSV